jgi:hypothetical protein
MIGSLIFKDLLLVRHRMLVLLAVMALMLSTTDGRPRSASVYGAIIVHMLTCMVLIHAGVVEEKSRGEVLLPLLPLGRGQIVRARYASLLCVSVFFAVAYLVMLAAGGGVSMAAVDWLATAGRCMSITLAIWSFGLPIVMAYGVTRSQLLLTLGTMALPGVALSVIRAVTLPSGDWQVFVRAVASPWTLAAVLALVALSYAVSVRVYERRDF